MHRREYLQALLGASLLGGLWTQVHAHRRPARRERGTLRLWGGEREGDQRAEFPRALLELLIRDRELPAREPIIGLSQAGMQQGLFRGFLDIAVLPSLGIERGLQVVPWPLRRGLLGLRLIVIHAQQRSAFKSIRTLGDLKRKRLSLAEDWIEFEPLRRLGFDIAPATSYPHVFEQLHRAEAEYTLRSVTEVLAELADPGLGRSELEVLPGIAVFYPLDDYFVLAPELNGLATVLEQSMASVFNSEEYWALFNLHFATALEFTHLPSRKILSVRGFGIDPDTPLERFDAIELRPTSGQFRLQPRT